jgi:serine/threonine protein kinase
MLAGSLIREGRAASRVRHPGVVGVTDFGKLEDGRAYLVMEYVESGTLSAALKAGPFPVVRALQVAREVADALEAVHAVDVVHGDIKPSNIFLLPGDKIKLVDFGAARVIGAPSPTDGKIFVGTPGYLAPECVRGELADRRVDVYALGCVIYRMISGAVPFQAATVAETLRGHAEHPPPRIATPTQVGGLSSPVDAIIARALAKKPVDRYPSAGAMRDEIDLAIKFLLPRERAS